MPYISTPQTPSIASGTVVNYTQDVSPINSAGSFSLITQEAISGVRAVSISPSGNIQIAMASVSGRMPAIGVAYDNVLSGIALNVHTTGVLQFASGLANFSGFIGSELYVGRSGQVTQLSGSWTSGNMASGDVAQVLGLAINSGAAFFDVAPAYRSGGFAVPF